MAIKLPNVETEFFPLAGGLDVTSQRLTLKPGRARSMLNYYGKLGGGYRRLGGYEPYDGRARPSRQEWFALYAATTYAGVVVGDTVNGQTSGATGKVIEIGEAGEYIVVTRVTGSFTNGENIRVGAAVVGVYSEASDPGTLDGFDMNRLYALTEAEYRTSIGAVPGEGDVLGVFEYKGLVYALRNNVGSTQALLYKESAAGWVNVPMSEEVAFSNANTAVGEGDTLTQGGVTATIKRVCLASGSLASGTNTGYLVISGRAGGSFAGGAATSTGGGNVTLGGAQQAITLSPNGDYRFVEYNFTGSADTSRIYGCDGVNYGFEFDGTTWARVRTGMSSDVPSFVVAHKNQLFFSFRGSVQHSSPGTPFVWSPITGAAEIGMGADVTGFLVLPGSETNGALMIFCKDRIRVLYGSGSSDWKLTNFAEKVGAAAGSLQIASNKAMFMDALGITSADTSQSFGGFRAGAISNAVQPLVQGRRDDVVCSYVSRDLSLYVLLFNDQSGLVITFGSRGIECIAPIMLEHQATCAWETQRNGGEVFIGCSDGFVYQMECGRSFAGEAVTAYFLLAFNHSKGPLIRKQYRRAFLECGGESAFTLNTSYSLDYDSAEVTPGDLVEKSLQSIGGRWDVSNWDEVIYDGTETATLLMTLRGFGRNISIGVHSESAEELPHEFEGVLMNYTQRRMERDYA